MFTHLLIIKKSYHEKLQNREIRFIDAISEAIEISMKNHPNLVLMGQDIAEYGGAFKITEGFVEKFEKKESEIHHCVKLRL